MKALHLKWLAGLALFAAAGFLGWVFTLHGTAGFLHVDSLSRYLTGTIAAIGVLPALLLLARSLVHRQRARRGFAIATVTAGCLALLVFLAGLAFISGFPTFSPGDVAPFLEMMDGAGAQGVPDIAVVAHSASPLIYRLAWGRDGSAASTTIDEKSASKDHVFMLRDLEPGTQYWYRVGDSDTRHFFTPDVKDGSVRFAVASDTHIAARANRKDLTAAMVARIGARDGPSQGPSQGPYNFFFSLGDLVEFGFRGSEWDEAFTTLSPAASVVPTVFVPGNHDMLFGLRDFGNYCYPPGTARDSKGGVELWRRIDSGNVHFLALDVEWSAETLGAEQIAWLETQLKSIPAGDWKIVMNHGFYYLSGVAQRGWQWWDNPETIDRVTPLFEKYGVNLVFSGHAHQMEVLEKSGVTYVITGAFGGRPDPERTYVSPASVWYASGQEGFVDVSLSGDQARLTFTGPDGGEINHFVVTKTGLAGQWPWPLAQAERG